MNYEEEIRRLQTMVAQLQAQIIAYSNRLSVAESTIFSLEKNAPAPAVAPHV